MTDITLDDLDARLAETAAGLLKTILQAVRTRHHDDEETLHELATLTACRLSITAVGPEIQLELVGPVEGGTKRFYGATFSEMGTLQ
jgi:hypothetical protein